MKSQENVHGGANQAELDPDFSLTMEFWFEIDMGYLAMQFLQAALIIY
jgi:hypothetical protein